MERVRDQFRERDSLSSHGSLNSPLHSSDFSLNSTKSSVSSEDRLDTLSDVSSLHSSRDQDLQAEISEQMINFVKKIMMLLF